MALTRPRTRTHSPADGSIWAVTWILINFSVCGVAGRAHWPLSVGPSIRVAWMPCVRARRSIWPYRQLQTIMRINDLLPLATPRLRLPGKSSRCRVMTNVRDTVCAQQWSERNEIERRAAIARSQFFFARHLILSMKRIENGHYDWAIHWIVCGSPSFWVSFWMLLRNSDLRIFIWPKLTTIGGEIVRENSRKISAFKWLGEWGNEGIWCVHPHRSGEDKVEP